MDEELEEVVETAVLAPKIRIRDDGGGGENAATKQEELQLALKLKATNANNLMMRQ